MTRLLEIQENLQDTYAALAQHEKAVAIDPASRALRLSSKSLEKRRRKLEAAFLEAANDLGVDVCSYRLFSNDDKKPTAIAVASSITTFQKMVSIMYDALKNGPKRVQRLAAETIEQTSFDFGYSFSGSLGIVLTMPNERLLADVETTMDEAMRMIFEVIKTNETDKLTEFSRQLGLAPLRATYKWADAHVRNGLGVAISWQRDRDIRMSTTVELSEIDSLRRAIAATSEVDDTTATITGILIGGDLPSKRFHFQPDVGSEIRGTYSDAIRADSGHTLGERYCATVVRSEVVHYSTAEQDVKYHLVSLEEISDKSSVQQPPWSQADEQEEGEEEA